MTYLISTVGHSNRTADEFLTLLHHYGIQRLVDVRTQPRSRFPHFRRDALARLLHDASIDYVWLGDTLGGLRPEGYPAWTTSDAFASGLARLATLATASPTAFMCAERDPRQCHRRFIAQALLDQGWQVRHLLSPGEAYMAAPEALQLSFDMA